MIDFKKKSIAIGPPSEIKLSREQVIGSFTTRDTAWSRSSTSFPTNIFEMLLG